MFYILGNYPNELPGVSVPNHLKPIGLLSHLISVATPLIGNPMLYVIIDAAKDWIEDNQHKIEQSLNHGNKTDNVCKFFLQGKCRFGIHCINIHPGASAQSETNPSPEPETQSTVPNSKHKSAKKDSSSPTKKVPVTKPTTKTTTDEEEENTKKERMRTATEVISRILWDPDLPPEDFIVGYLDRFIGIQEKGFKDFSWEDISTVGADVLAVPKHRIQYFKYKGMIVWDKRTQMDDFFGSRGGKTIDMIVDKPDEPDKPDNKDDVSDSNVDAEIDLIDNEIGDERPLAHRHGNQPRPTHFVCLRVTEEEVKARVKKVTDHVIKLNPQLADGIIKSSSLHVTLCMIQLANDEQIEIAKKVFQSCQLQFLSVLPRCFRIEFTGVDNFRERLIYIKVKPLPGLNKFVSHIIEQFQLAGLKTPGNRDEFTPHITLIKLSRPMQKQLDTKLINPECYRPFLTKNLGSQMITNVHLCAMHAPAQADGFYLKYGTITNSLIGLPSEVVRLVEDKLIQLTSKGFLENSECKVLVSNLHEAVSQGNETMFDNVIQDVISYNYEASMYKSCNDTTTTVIVMRGLPGSGKTYLSSNCQEILSDPLQVSVISADQFFTEGSNYQFNPSDAFKAHQQCTVRFLEAICAKKKLVIIDNTNSQQWEYILYIYLCDVFGIKCHLLEIPCPSQSISARFRGRNQHKLQAPAIAKMLQRWEEDSRAVIVPPSLAYPRDWTSITPQPFSILRLCDSLFLPLPESVKELSNLVVVYSGIFLTSNSQWDVLSLFHPSLTDIQTSHVTLSFLPDIAYLKKLPIGKKVKIKIVGHAENSKTQACVVDVPLTSDNKTPHITISTAEGIAPKSTNIMLQNQVVRSCDTKVVEGIVGVAIRQAIDEEINGNEDVPNDKIASMASYVVTSSIELKAIIPKLVNDIGTATTSTSLNSIVTYGQKITKLFIFDFDGTLTVAPGPIEGRKMYEQATGRKWPHKGWLGWPESLSLPMRVLPGPALAEYRNHVNRAGSYTIILTGRVENTKPGFMKVLENFQIIPDKIYFKPDITDESTSAFKLRITKQLLAEEFSDVTLVKFWDDMPENLWAINWLSQSEAMCHIQFDIIDATEMNLTSSVSKHGRNLSLLKTNTQINKIKYDSSLQECLANHGYLPTIIYQKAVQQGIEFIANQFTKLVDYEGNPLDLIYLFGSYPLKRSSDVDMCLIAPNSHTNIEWIDKMASQLQSCGVKHVHVGHSSRCPRLKIALLYSETTPIEYDIVIALIPKDTIFTIPAPTEQLPASKIAQMRKPGDNASKVALSGPLFMEKIEEMFKQTEISHESFGAIVEMIVQIFVTKREKGNAYHCIRTFHIVQLLIDYIQQNGSILSLDMNCDVLFKGFLGYVTEVQYGQWEKLFGESVPETYIPRVMAVFKECSQMLKPSEPVTVRIYEDLLQRAEYPHDNYIPVNIKISGKDEFLKWKAGIIVEARLPSYVRQIISRGLDVRPDGNVKNCNKYSFSVPPLKSAKDTLQEILRPFWVELAELRKQDGLSILLNFDQSTTTTSSPALDALSSTANNEPKTAEIIEQVTTFAAQVSSKDSSSPKQLHLPTTLTSHARLLVHEAAERLGLQHSSVGIGKDRHVVLQLKTL